VNGQKVEISVEKIHEELSKTTQMMYDAMKMTDMINKRLIAALMVICVCFSAILITYIVVNTTEVEMIQGVENTDYKISNGGNLN